MIVAACFFYFKGSERMFEGKFKSLGLPGKAIENPPVLVEFKGVRFGTYPIIDNNVALARLLFENSVPLMSVDAWLNENGREQVTFSTAHGCQTLTISELSNSS